MPEENFHFLICMRYENALEAVGTCLIRNGFGIENRHDISSKAEAKPLRASDNAHELTIFDALQDGTLTGTLNSVDHLPQVVIRAGLGGVCRGLRASHRQ